MHAADLFGTAQDARDLAAVVQALHLGPVDLYGDSYGSWFAQVFTARYPRLLRSVVLDSTYEVRGLDPWYRTSVTTARAGFDRVCARSAACAGQAPGSSWARIGLLAQQLRRHPVSGWTTGLDGARVRVRVDVRALVDLVNDAGYDPAPVPDPGRRGPAPCSSTATPSRCCASTPRDVGYDVGDYSGPADAYSDGTYYAVACTDYPQLFDVTVAPATRRAQLAAAVRALPASTFAPFSTAEWVGVNQYTEAYSACLDWPASVHHDLPLPTLGAPLDPGGVPVLVLAGELDSLTPAAGGEHVARQLGPAARAVVAANTVHLVALDDRYGCGADLYQRFVRSPSALHRLDASCARRVPELHAVGSFPTRLEQVRPAGGSGAVPPRTRRLAAVAVAAVGDAAARWPYVNTGTDLGLRGGRVGYLPDADGVWVTTTLHRVRWLATGAVSGVVKISSDALSAHGTVTVTDGDGPAIRCTVSWQTNRPGALAQVRVDGVTLTLPAP